MNQSDLRGSFVAILALRDSFLIRKRERIATDSRTGRSSVGTLAQWERVFLQDVKDIEDRFVARIRQGLYPGSCVTNYKRTVTRIVTDLRVTRIR